MWYYFASNRPLGAFQEDEMGGRRHSLFLKKVLKIAEEYFSGYLFWVGYSIHLQKSYKPYQYLCEATL